MNEPPVDTKIVPPAPPKHEPQQYGYARTPWWKTTAELVGIAAVVAYTIFSGFQMHYAGQQAEAARENLQTMKDQFQLDRRPVIAASNYTIFDTETQKTRPPVIGHPFGVTITLKNVGKSTAFHLYIHRHLLFGKQYPGGIKIEPPDTQKVGVVLESESQIYATAVSVKDTYSIESTYIPPADFVAWDGSTPIVLFGRATYEDSFGKLYCTPFAAAYLNAQTWSNMSNFSPTKIQVSDLCPDGTL